MVGVVDIPVLDVAYNDGLAILDAANVSLSADTTIVTSTTENVIADLPGVNPDNVIMAGAHLDSVLEGPGVQDNGSGSAVILAIALAMGNNKKYTPQNTVRFAWWGAEESGLIGSEEYIFNPDFGITQEEYDALAGYINFDMIGSPNFIYGVLPTPTSQPSTRRSSFHLVPRRWKTCSRRTTPIETSPTRTPSSRVGPTTRPSSMWGFPQAGSSPVPRASRCPSNRRSGVARRVSSTTSATTRPATPSTT